MALRILAAYQLPVLVVVVGAVGVERVGALPGSPTSAAYWWYRLDQRNRLGDVVTVAAGQGDGQGNATAVGDHVVF